MVDLSTQASSKMSAEKLRRNPDGGSKTPRWEEVRLALAHMVRAAKRLRATYV